MPETASSRKRNMDRRRESSRYAARDRRGKETNIFTELKDVVPLVTEPTITHIDRIAQLRLAATLVRLRGFASTLMNTTLNADDVSDLWSEEMICNCLDGFVMICGSDGVILYITESVSVYLGLTQTDLVGRLLQDFVGRDDYDEMAKVAGENDSSHASGRLIVMRMKSVISPRGRNLNLKSALMKPITFRLRTLNSSDKGRITLLQATTAPAGQGNSYGSVAKGDAPSGTFMTRHTCDMKFSYVNESVNYYLKLDPKALMGTSFYDLVHPADLLDLVNSLKELFKKSHCRTPYYRLVGATGAVVWVQTEATTVSHTTRGQRGQYVICVHQILGMQSGSDSSTANWIVEDACPAAVAAVAAVNIKAEIDDTHEYLETQSHQQIECVDFTPLISEDSYRQEPRQPAAAARSSRIGTRKDLYNDVLQWLFRDHPDSPPPSIAFPRSATDSDPTLSAVAFPPPRPSPTQQQQQPQQQQLCFRRQQQQCSPVAMDSGATSPYRGGVNSMECSPTSGGMDVFQLQPATTPTLNNFAAPLASPRPTAAQPHVVVGDVFYGNAAVDANGRHGGNANRRLSTVQTSDCYSMPNAVVGEDRRRKQYGDTNMFAVMSPTHLKAAPHTTGGAPLTDANSSDSSISIDSSELLETLAPFVAQEEMMPLDLEGLLPEYNFDDLFSTESKQMTTDNSAFTSPLNNFAQPLASGKYAPASSGQMRQLPQYSTNVNPRFQPIPQQQPIGNMTIGRQQQSGALGYGCGGGGQPYLKFNDTGAQQLVSPNNCRSANVMSREELRNGDCTEARQWDKSSRSWNGGRAGDGHVSFT